MDFKSRRSYPRPIQNTQALPLTPSELRERALQRRVNFSVIFSILEPKQFSLTISSRWDPDAYRVNSSVNSRELEGEHERELDRELEREHR